MSGETNWWDGYNRLDLDSAAFTEWAREVVPELLHEIDTLRTAISQWKRYDLEERRELDALRRERNSYRAALVHLDECGAVTAEGVRNHVRAILESVKS